MPQNPDLTPLSLYEYSLRSRSNQIRTLVEPHFQADLQAQDNHNGQIGTWFEWAGYLILTNHYLRDTRFFKSIQSLPTQIGAYPKTDHELMITDPALSRKLGRIINPNEPIATPDGYIFDQYQPNKDIFLRLLGVVEYSAERINLVEKINRLKKLLFLLQQGQTPELVHHFFATAADRKDIKPVFIEHLHLVAISFLAHHPQVSQIGPTRFPTHSVVLDVKPPSVISQAKEKSWTKSAITEEEAHSCQLQFSLKTFKANRFLLS